MSFDLSKLSQFAQGGELERSQPKLRAAKAKPVRRFIWNNPGILLGMLPQLHPHHKSPASCVLY